MISKTFYILFLKHTRYILHTTFTIYRHVRGLDGRDNFWALLITLRRRALYKYTEYCFYFKPN